MNDNNEVPAKDRNPRPPLRSQRRDPGDRLIDSIIREFDTFIRDSLINYVKTGVSNDTVISELAEEFFRREEYQDFQWNILRTSGGAFGFSHSSRKDFVLLQTPYVRVDEEIRGIDIPYLPIQYQGRMEYAELIDYLFLGRRRRQPLLGDKESPYAPEFFWHLAQVYDPQREVRHQSLIPPSHFEKHLAEVPYLYCPAGEVTFFLYAWRLLFRLCQKNNSPMCNPTQGMSLRESPSFNLTDIWSKNFWEGQGKSESDSRLLSSLPETGWVGALEDLESSGKTENKDTKVSFYADVRRQWKYWRDKLDTDPRRFVLSHQPWASDWINLGLIHCKERTRPRYAQPRDALLSLILFSHHIEKREEVRLQLKEYARRMGYEEKGRIQLKREDITWGRLMQIDSTLQDVVHHTLTKGGEVKGNLLSRLFILHKLARLPVLPMFYWTAVERRPKEHFVFPVWESWRFPVTVAVPVDKMSETSESKQVSVPSVAVGLFALNPLRDLSFVAFDNIFHQKDPARLGSYTKIYRSAHKHLSLVARFFSHISRSMIDSAFYTLVQESVRKEQSLKIRSDLAATFSHAYQKRATMFANSFSEFARRTLALDMEVNPTTGESSSGLFNLFKETGRVDSNDSIPYGEIKIFDSPQEIKRSDLIFAFDHREALEWYKTDIDTFHKISRFDKTFEAEKFREPLPDERKDYLYFLALVKLIESIVILKYQGDKTSKSTYGIIFGDYRPSQEWSFLLTRGSANLKNGDTDTLDDIERLVKSSNFPIQFEFKKESVLNPRVYIKIFDSVASSDTRLAEQSLLIEILGKVLSETFLNTLQGAKSRSSTDESPLISVETSYDDKYFCLDITTNCSNQPMLETLEVEKFKSPSKPEYTQGGWGRYGNLVIMRDYLKGDYQEKKSEKTKTVKAASEEIERQIQSGIITRLKFPKQIIGEDVTNG